ncbi:sugar transferase [Gemella morbillorum]|jgi:putative colanic biosynthesis UDP-glucose lipid carrier transferase|uniref:Sugar transferase n=1 Tax=Gemella morbillorum TaxID=29391 RepID=A0AAP9HD82_9BACL|nr:sugar transferase [Gemella morbillorum]EFV35020.1 sugar transferase [Gemella morbillorum M424]MDK8238983.1 sugar transferase [Gemella morbillorum]MDK8254390.1 sugar transferase [Gemella morbillorum]QGS09036.1 sugar transferase [Gemella morbillorum]
MNIDKRFETEIVKKYREEINKRKISLFLKLFLDKILALILLIPLSPIILAIAIWIKLDSEGPVFYRQERITTYGRPFRIFKFRTMVKDADKLGAAVTEHNDPRISRAGDKLRKVRLDELPQLFNVLLGDMSFVGVRPEVAKYVNRYTDEMNATLLLPAGITSPASIEYKDEDEVIEKFKGTGRSIDDIYIEEVLPDKMKYNLEYIKNFSIINDIKIMIQTALAVIK